LKDKNLMNSRIIQLLDFLKEDPSDPFTKYALAIEYLNSDKTQSLGYFKDLLDNHPEYIGTYYHAAGLYAELEETEMAKLIYEKGIKEAEKQKNTHALRELKTAYQNFLFEL
jgi:tetratricopeptide (TPR) repeat protein